MKTFRFRFPAYFLLLIVGTISLRARTSVASPPETPAPSKDAPASQATAFVDQPFGPHGPMDWCWIKSFSPNGRFFVTADNYEQKNCVRDMASGKMLAELPKNILTAVFSPDSTMIACRQEEGPRPYTRYVWQVYATADGKPMGAGFALAESECVAVCFSRDSKLLAGITGGPEGYVNIWDAATGKRLAQQPAKGSFASAFTLFSPDGEILAGFGEGNAVLLWSVPDLRLLKILPFCNKENRLGAESPLSHGRTAEIFTTAGNKAFAMAAAFSPDGKHLAVSGTETRRENGSEHDYPIGRLYEVATGKVMAKPKVSPVRNYLSRQIVFVPGGRVFVTASNMGVQAWSTSDGSLLANLPGATSPIAVSPDGKILAAGQGSERRLYNTSHWTAGIALLGAAAAENQAVLPFFSPMQFSSDGQTLTHAQYSVISVYEMPSGRLKIEHKATQFPSAPE